MRQGATRPSLPHMRLSSPLPGRISMKMNRSSVSVTVRALLPLGLLVLAAGPAAAAVSARTNLQGSVPSWASAKNRAGTVDSSTAVGFRVYLGWTDPAGAEALARA